MPDRTLKMGGLLACLIAVLFVFTATTASANPGLWTVSAKTATSLFNARHHLDAVCFGRKPVDHWKLNTPYFTHFNCVWPDTEVGPQAWEKYHCGLFHLLSQYGNFVMTNVRPC
jgi:hypothetical protein